MTTNLDTLLTALYVLIDDHVIPCGPRRPGHPKKLSDAELVCLAVAQVLLGARNEHHWLRMCQARLGHLFPYLPKQPGYHKRIKAAAPLICQAISYLATQCPSWHSDLRLLDATPIPCAASRQAVKRSALAGWANYGYCPSHSRWYWGPRSPASSAKVRVPRRELRGELPLAPWAAPWVRGQSSASRSMGLRRSCRAAVA